VVVVDDPFEMRNDGPTRPRLERSGGLRGLLQDVGHEPVREREFDVGCDPISDTPLGQRRGDALREPSIDAPSRDGDDLRCEWIIERQCSHVTQRVNKLIRMIGSVNLQPHDRDGIRPAGDSGIPEDDPSRMAWCE